jgi:hypothetical protein
VVVPQNTGNAVPRSGRMRDFRESRSPANLVVLKGGKRSSASLGGRAKDCAQSFLNDMGIEEGFTGRRCRGKPSHKRIVRLDAVLNGAE